MAKQSTERDESRKPFHDEEMAAKEAVPKAPAAGGIERDFFTLDDIFKRILATADHELERHAPLLMWSGLAAGLALGLTFYARALLTALAPEGGTVLLGNLLYPIGFVIIVLGRYQLFTENTLTPVTLVLTRLASFLDLFRLWGIVYGANMVGALTVAVLLATTGVFEPQVAEFALGFGEHALSFSWGELFAKAVASGWLVAIMVWLVHAARDTMARLLLVWIVMFLVGAGNLFHCITGSVEVFYLAMRGQADFLALFPDFIFPVTLGNTVGGVIFVAIVNYMQVEEEPFNHYGSKLPWRAWIWGQR